jgi:hypothetical protein
VTVSSESSALLRWLVESLVPLAAPPEAQVAYAHANGEPVNELMHDYWDWTYEFVPQLEAEQLVSAAVADLLHRIVARLSGPELSEWALLPCEAAVTDPAWGDVRVMAQQALDALRARGV